jgi:WhiB family redox-sensing transcriptional regulator
MADTRRLPPPVAEVWTWQMRAACRGIDSAVFFHPERERGQAKAIRDARAKEVCRVCPVLEACRRHALSAEEPYGVWGGMTVDERRAIARASGDPATGPPDGTVHPEAGGGPGPRHLTRRPRVLDARHHRGTSGARRPGTPGAGGATPG